MCSKLRTTKSLSGSLFRNLGQKASGLARLWSVPLLTGLLGLSGVVGIGVQGGDATFSEAAPASEVEFQRYRVPSGPVSIHVARVPRGKSSFEVRAVHAQGRAVGLSQLSDQVALLDSPLATPIAAINGDFYQRGGPYAGDPRGLQIVENELISAPSGSVSFWIDALGEPHLTNTVSLLQVTWPDGTTAPIGLNGTRRRDGIELYTPALGASTRTSGGRELILERNGNSQWLPLRPGRLYLARVRDVREGGDTRISPGTMILSMGPTLTRTGPRVSVGAELIISMATLPSLRGVKTAIGGGPVLVRDGKRQRIQPSDFDSDSDSYKFSSMTERHPRSAIGWNDNYFFLVQVDGRQRNWSVGLSLNELAAYLVELGCREAMGLDGGGSATFWYNGQVRNRPCDGYERSIANSLVVVKRKDSQTSEHGAGGSAAAGPRP